VVVGKSRRHSGGSVAAVAPIGSFPRGEFGIDSAGPSPPSARGSVSKDGVSVEVSLESDVPSIAACSGSRKGGRLSRGIAQGTSRGAA